MSIKKHNVKNLVIGRLISPFDASINTREYDLITDIIIFHIGKEKNQNHITHIQGISEILNTER